MVSIAYVGEMAKLMTKLSKHKSPQVREVVARAMARLEDKSVIDPLIVMATKDGNSIVRLEACKALGVQGAVKARPALLKVADRAGRSFIMALGMSLFCPYESVIDPDLTLDCVHRLRNLGGTDLVRLYGEPGWLDRPALYHRTPPPLEKPHLVTRRVGP